MKLTKSLVGKDVRVTWIDPRVSHITSHDPAKYSDIPRGRAALATWTEYGMVLGIEDGVLHLAHGIGADPVTDHDPTHTINMSWIPEDLITKMEVATWAGEAEGRFAPTPNP